MSFTSYLVKKFNYNHENEYFRSFTTQLTEAFDKATEEHILIGNLSCNGHQMDALFISSGRIIVIDFKDYEGSLTFSENNPWKLTNTKGELVFVQGGAQSRNPFQQVNAYRWALMNFLQVNEKEIIRTPRNNVKWNYINSLVLFQREVKFDKSTIPTKVSRFFHIADHISILDTINDLGTQSLLLSNEELSDILKVLDISEANLYFPAPIEGPTPEPPYPTGAERLIKIQRFLKISSKATLSQKVLSYYRTILQLERSKEPNISELFTFQIEPNQNIKEYQLDLSVSKPLLETYLKDLQNRFPSNLFVAVGINLEGKVYPLIYTIVTASDLKRGTKATINLNETYINTKVLENLGLGDNILEKLINSVNEAKTVKDKIELLKKDLDPSAKLSGSLLVGLSSENLFANQLISELEELIKLEEEYFTPLFQNFLLNNELQDPYEHIPITPLIQISSLNPSQKESVEKSFAQPLTVITGPPGTGKSQVVGNIIANAIVHNQSVVFASKNNKAVDNVKERVLSILDQPYLMKIGSKTEITETIKPLLKDFVSKYQNNAFSNTSSALPNLLDQIGNIQSRNEFLKQELAMIPILEKQINEKEQHINEILNQRESWSKSLDPYQRNLIVKQALSLTKSKNEFLLLHQQLERYSKGAFSILVFNLFLKRKFSKNLNKIISDQPLPIQDFIDSKLAEMPGGNEFITFSIEKLSLLITLKGLSNQAQEFEILLDEQIADKQKIEDQYNELIQAKQEYLEEISDNEKKLPELGTLALNAAVSFRLSKLNVGNLQDFIDYIPSSNIRNNDELEAFKICNKLFLKDFKAVCLTNLSVKNSMSLQAELVDLLVIDEASQCDIASALPLIFRAKKIVIIGDPLQLKHITSVQTYEDKYIKDELEIGSLGLDYTGKSLYDYCFNLASKSKMESVFLKDHYRSHPEIIKFSNDNFYLTRLGQSMDIRTYDEQFSILERGLFWVHVDGEMNRTKNSNYKETLKVIELARTLADLNPTHSIGIVTPFKDQSLELKSKLPFDLREKVKIDTVHNYQGDEMDIMIFSTVVSPSSAASKAKFLNSNEYLINVAITRARAVLYIVGNHQFCKTMKSGKIKLPLARLAEYTEHLNKVRM